MSEPYITKQTLTYSDGAEKVIEFVHNPNADAIEKASAEMVADNTAPEATSEVTASEPASEVGEVTASEEVSE